MKCMILNIVTLIMKATCQFNCKHNFCKSVAAKLSEEGYDGCHGVAMPLIGQRTATAATGEVYRYDVLFAPIERFGFYAGNGNVLGGALEEELNECPLLCAKREFAEEFCPSMNCDWGQFDSVFKINDGNVNGFRWFLKNFRNSRKATLIMVGKLPADYDPDSFRATCEEKLTYPSLRSCYKEISSGALFCLFERDFDEDEPTTSETYEYEYGETGKPSEVRCSGYAIGITKRLFHNGLNLIDAVKKDKKVPSMFNL